MTALPLIAVALAAVGTGVGVYGAVAQGDAAKDAGKRQQDIANQNAKAEQAAAALEAGQIRRRNLLRLGSQRAGAAKSGVLIDDSAMDVITDSAIQGELEALSAIYSGSSSAAAHRNRGSLAAWEGRRARSASYINAGSTLIGGIGLGVGNYNQATEPTFGSGGGGYGTRYKKDVE